ncbi:hypothetical protein MKW94_019567 [Papaver nudicaule]|uniref:Uncharacterized protein n=1 Tax=Papaver nudicaule TaxID=74823 RepID=A0AA41SKN4_PAPNU|nr:hypothetical protein [Papaver nudicaule]
MQELAKKGSDPIWWTSSGSQNPQSCLSKSISINMGSSPPDCRNAKQLGFQLQDQDSTSTQSTGQSHHEVLNMSGDHTKGQCVSAQSDITYGKQGDAQNKSILSLGTPEFVFPHPVEYANPVARLPYPYIDPYYTGIVTSYGPQAIILDTVQNEQNFIRLGLQQLPEGIGEGVGVMSTGQAKMQNFQLILMCFMLEAVVLSWS